VLVRVLSTGSDQPTAVATLVSGYTELVFVALVPVFLIAGFHFADWGQEAGNYIAAAVTRGRIHWPLILLTALASLAICARLVFEFLPGLRDLAAKTPFAAQAYWILVALTAIGMLFLGAIVTRVGYFVVRALTWLGRLDRWPTMQVPSAVVTALLLVPWTLILVLSFSLRAFLPTLLPDWADAAAFAGLMILAPLVALAFLLVGRWRVGRLAVTGVFTVVGLLAAPYLSLHLSQGIVPGFELLVAPATVIVLAHLMRRGELGGHNIELIRLLFVLNVGLQVVDWIRLLYPAAQQNNQLNVAQGLFFIGAFLWHLLLSGDDTTNIEGRIVPRYVRVLVYLGYSLLLSTVVLFLSSVRLTTGPLASAPLFNNHLYARAGLQLLGVPLLLTLFVLGAARWHARRNAYLAPAQHHPPVRFPATTGQ
jgi:hypothetical protein